MQEEPRLAATPIIVVGGREPTPAELSRVGAASSAVWPATQATLLDVTMSVLRDGGARRAIKPAIHTSPERQPGSVLRILVADDVPENRLLLAALCEKHGHVLTFATNGLEAVEAYRNGEFDVVLMDIQMPEMGGTEATVEIRRIESGRGSRTPVIALTSHAMKGDREKYLANGMDGYVSKPIQRDLLFREIAKGIAVRPVAA